MTTPFDSKSYAKDPTAPTAAPAGYVTPRQPDTARREPPFDSTIAEAMRGKLIELIIRQLLTAIFGFFAPGGGTAFSQFATWAQAVPFIGGTLSSAITFITNFLDPAKLLFSQTRVQNPPQTGWPLPFGTVWGELTATPIQLLVQNLSRFLSPGALTGGSLISTAFTTPTALLSFIENILLPRNRVAERDATTGLVPDSQKPQAVQDIVDHANNAVVGNPIGSVINFGVETFFDVIGGLFGAGSNAQSVNIHQNAQIDSLLVGGGSSAISETFDGASAGNLGANFTQFYYGSGSGSCGTDGNGNAVWFTAGGATRACINEHVTVLTTDTQKASIVVKYNLANQNVTDPEVKIQVRCKSDMSECIEARISYNSCEIGYVVANSYTRLGSATSIGTSSGVWELKAGTAASSRQFILTRDGDVKCSQTDSLASSAMGASNRQVAFTLQAGLKYFYVYAQTTTGTIDSFSGSDTPIV